MGDAVPDDLSGQGRRGIERGNVENASGFDAAEVIEIRLGEIGDDSLGRDGFGESGLAV